MEGLDKKKLAEMIDQTLLKPFVTLDDMKIHCETADKYGFKTVAVNNAVVKYCAGLLQNSRTVCDAAVSFPLGPCTLETKIFETNDVIEKGAKEVDYVVNIVELKSGNWEYIEKEMISIVNACNKNGVISKVIFENCYLNDDEKRKLCQIALKVHPNFIKTSTGFGSGGATEEDIRLMKSVVGDEIKIKAAGGIRDLRTALSMIRAGASRIGTSCGTQIIDELK